MSLCISTHFRELLVAGAGLPAGAGGRVLRGLAEARLHHALQRGLRRGLQGLHHLARIRPRNHQAETREHVTSLGITTIFLRTSVDRWIPMANFSRLLPPPKSNRQSITEPLRFIHLRTAEENLIWLQAEVVNGFREEERSL